jgi:DNA-binding transcriptional LysR family regulator
MNHLDWDGLQILLAVHAAGSLRGAARTLHISQPTLGRRLASLEEQLGSPLLIRHARGVLLTEDGLVALDAGQRVATELDALRRTLSGRTAQVAGRVRVSCTEPIAERLGASLITLRQEHPALKVDVVVDAHASDLDRREADIAIRMFDPTSPSLVARKIGETFTQFYASRAYIAAHGRPAGFDDLDRHAFIGPDRDPLFVGQAKAMGFHRDQMAYCTDATAIVKRWVTEGVAIGALLGCSVGDDLVPLLTPLARHPVWLVTHPDLRGSATVSAVWKRLAADLPERLTQA